MQAAVFDRVGPPAEVLSVREVPQPVPGRGEVLVKMLASPVNPSDLMYIRGVYGLKPSLPATPGFEGVGVVVGSGGGLLGWLRKGVLVAVLNDTRGNWSEYTVVPARKVLPIAGDIPDEQAAAVFVNPVTVLAMIQYVLKLQAGDVLLQNAAASELGTMIVRLSKVMGFRTINVVRRAEAARELRNLGAEHVIVEGDGSVEEQVKAIMPEGVKYALDPVGGASGAAIANCLGRGGRMLVYGALSGEPTPIHPRGLITHSSIIEGFWLANWAQEQSIPTMLAVFRRAQRFIREGVFTARIAKSYPLAEVNAAVAHAEQPARGGKILLRMNG